MTNSPTNLENAERAEMTMTPHAYAQEYEFRGDTDYTPSDFERTMIEDAILGYLGEARIAERAERGTFSPPFSYVPIPLDEEGQGPADDVDAVSVAHDVWDANCVTVATCGNEEAARSVAALMNAGVEARIRAERAEMEPKPQGGKPALRKVASAILALSSPLSAGDTGEDHARGCEGRSYTCTCGYDDARDAEIDRLRRELEEARRKAFEEAAGIADTEGRSWCAGDAKTSIGQAYQNACINIAAAIRKAGGADRC